MGITRGKSVGGMQHPEIREYAFDVYRRISLNYGGVQSEEHKGHLKVTTADGKVYPAKTVLLAIGRSPVFDTLDLKKAGVMENK